MNPYLFEFLATLTFVYVIISTGNAYAIGACLCLIILVGSEISGASVNPAVSLALFTSGKLDSKHLLPYIGAEVAGAIVAVQLYNVIKKASKKMKK
jgi:glycerol uptake facilitator-like aquaporin